MKELWVTNLCNLIMNNNTELNAESWFIGTAYYTSNLVSYNCMHGYTLLYTKELGRYTFQLATFQVQRCGM